jgi:hypothetical protein
MLHMRWGSRFNHDEFASGHGDVGNGAAGSFARHGNMFLRREAWIDEPGPTLAVGERGDGATGVLADLRVRGIVTGSHSGSMSGPFRLAGQTAVLSSWMQLRPRQKVVPQ